MSWQGFKKILFGKDAYVFVSFENKIFGLLSHKHPKQQHKPTYSQGMLQCCKTKLRPDNPNEFGQLWTWASRLLMRFEFPSWQVTIFVDVVFQWPPFQFFADCTGNRLARLYFGAPFMEASLNSQCLFLDSWFTGCDFPYYAMVQLKTEIHRRHLTPNLFQSLFVLGDKQKQGS